MRSPIICLVLLLLALVQSDSLNAQRRPTDRGDVFNSNSRPCREMRPLACRCDNSGVLRGELRRHERAVENYRRKLEWAENDLANPRSNRNKELMRNEVKRWAKALEAEEILHACRMFRATSTNDEERKNSCFVSQRQWAKLAIHRRTPREQF